MDHIVRAIAADGMIKATAISAKDMVERARQIHTTLPLATAALGRALMGASIMGDMMKTEAGSVTLQIKGGGPLGTITVVADSEGNARGYLQNGEVELMEKEPGKLDVGAGVGCDGTLTVIRDLHMKEPYVGSVQLVSGEIADDISAYYAESEQVPTACALGVLVDTDQSVITAGGYLIQLLPGADEDLISRLEGNIMKVGHATGVLKEGNFADINVFSLEDLKINATFAHLNRYCTGMDYGLVNGTPVIAKGEHTEKRAGRVLRRCRI